MYQRRADEYDVLVAGIQAAAIGLIDDLVFGAIDVGGSYKSPGEVAVELGKKVVVAAASIGINTAFNGVGKFVEKTDITGKVVRVAEAGNISKLVAGSLGDGFGQVALDATLAGVQTLATSTASAAINAVTYSAKDGFGYSYEAFAEGAKSGLASAAAAFTSAFTAGALGQLNLKIGNDALNGDTFNVGGIQKLNGLTGSLAGAGVSYAITGEATLNVLNLSDLTKGKYSSGLLELHLGGEDGASMSIGTGGTDISLGAIAGAMSGLRDSTKVIEAKIDNLMGDNRGVSTIDMINMLGWTGREYEQGLAKDIWDDIIKVTYEELGTNKNGDEILGKYAHGSGNEIFLDKDLLGGGKEGNAKMAAVLSHEGTHLNENRYEGIAHLQGNSTYETIKAIFGLRGDAEFSGQMIGAIMNPESWVENTGDVDYWDAVKTVNGSWGWLDDKSRNFDIRNILNDPEFGGIEAEFKEALRLSARDDDLKYGIISPGTLTPEIVKALLFPDLVFVGDDVSRMENGLMVLTPEQEANRRNDPSSMQGISDLIAYNRDHTTEPQVPIGFNQTMVEQAFGLTINSACVLSSIAWLNNAYVQQIKEWGLNSSAVINSLAGQTDKAYSGKGWVLDRNLVGQLVSGAYALTSAREYTSEAALKAAGYTYYTEERVHINDAGRKHTIAHANGITYDPYIKGGNRWWEDPEKSKPNRYVAYNTPGGNKN